MLSMSDSSQPRAGIDDAWRVPILTLVTMVAFAANSILCRQALSGSCYVRYIDPVQPGLKDPPIL